MALFAGGCASTVMAIGIETEAIITSFAIAGRTQGIAQAVTSVALATHPTALAGTSSALATQAAALAVKSVSLTTHPAALAGASTALATHPAALAVKSVALATHPTALAETSTAKLIHCIALAVIEIALPTNAIPRVVVAIAAAHAIPPAIRPFLREPTYCL
jgi:hypothetical protein